MENCLISIKTDGAEINSTIVGHYGGKLYLVNCQIKTNADWQTVSVSIDSRINEQSQYWQLETDGMGKWLLNGKDWRLVEGCIDVDLPLTPFTNTLPIRRLKLAVGEASLIDVVYLDLLAGEFLPVQQQYTRLTDKEYHYENVPNDFEANITVDEQGFVIDYPELFVRSVGFMI